MDEGGFSGNKREIKNVGFGEFKSEVFVEIYRLTMVLNSRIIKNNGLEE